MYIFNRLIAAIFLTALAAVAMADETIVMIRHGEKPSQGLGQLSCKGLNRALALPRVLESKFGRPAQIYAPNPGVQKYDRGVSYNYIRPLITIEPTAIKLGLPVNTIYGFDDTAGLEKALGAPDLQDKVVFVAWEHKLLEVIAKDILKAHGGDAALVPHWDDSDFDSIFVLKLKRFEDGRTGAEFHTGTQGLTSLDDSCRD